MLQPTVTTESSKRFAITLLEYSFFFNLCPLTTHFVSLFTVFSPSATSSFLRTLLFRTVVKAYLEPVSVSASSLPHDCHLVCVLHYRTEINSKNYGIPGAGTIKDREVKLKLALKGRKASAGEERTLWAGGSVVFSS